MIHRKTRVVCPHLIVHYNCSFNTATDSLSSTWRITFRDQQPVTISYNHRSTVNDVQIFNGIQSYLARYRRTEYIESVVSFEVFKDVTIQCAVNDVLIVDANLSVFQGVCFAI